jgi:hypothetical protein
LLQQRAGNFQGGFHIASNTSLYGYPYQMRFEASRLSIFDGVLGLINGPTSPNCLGHFLPQSYSHKRTAARRCDCGCYK